ncbi:unnamed protein product [Paramecium primaurelia]|uniref:Uncharacterized protein n=1 Tax=Paramecium primaurelia TaxID=5886 RepID=A0A8S1Q1E6_PARPR|nr:unnamed protein product [Paramecium primaurelia]
MNSQQQTNPEYFPPPTYYCNKNGHQLTWKSSSGHSCAECKIKNCRSRYWCQQCQEAFCLQCMPPPLFGIMCGAGHPMKLSTVPHHVCDYCSETIQNQAHRCQICDFDICPNCLLQKED